MKENNIRQGIPFHVDVKRSGSYEPVLNTFCILEDTAYRQVSKKWNSTIERKYCIANLTGGCVQSTRYNSVKEAIDFIQKNWKIIDANLEYVDIKTEIEEEREI